MSASIGFTVSQRASLIGGGDLRELLALGAEADRSGLVDTVWVGDSLTTKPRPDSIVCLGALAATTDVVRLGVACMATFPIRDPLQFAIQWSAIDQISNGRALLAACNGIQKAGGGSEGGEFRGGSAREGAFFGGVTDAERPARLEENVELVRRLWTGEPVDFDGRFVRYHDVQITPTVQQPAPVWLAGMPDFGSPQGDRFFDRVARIGDGYMITAKSPAVIRAAREHLDKALERHGRDPATFPVAAYTSVGIGDRDEVVGAAADFFTGYYGPGVFSPEVTGYAGIFGQPDEVIAEIVELVESGVSHVALRTPTYAPHQQLERLLGEVLPAVHEEVATPAGAAPSTTAATAGTR